MLPASKPKTEERIEHHKDGSVRARQQMLEGGCAPDTLRTAQFMQRIDIVDYYDIHNSAIPDHFENELQKRLETLREFPHVGHIGFAGLLGVVSENGSQSTLSRWQWSQMT